MGSAKGDQMGKNLAQAGPPETPQQVGLPGKAMPAALVAGYVLARLLQLGPKFQAEKDLVV